MLLCRRTTAVVHIAQRKELAMKYMEQAFKNREWPWWFSRRSRAWTHC